MVRKTTAEVKGSSRTSSSAASKQQSTVQDNIDLIALLQNARDGFKENWMTLVWFLLVLFSLIQLREFIFGIILLTTGILLISGFFWKK
jgi:hypothetical protein